MQEFSPAVHLEVSLCCVACHFPILSLLHITNLEHVIGHGEEDAVNKVCYGPPLYRDLSV